MISTLTAAISPWSGSPTTSHHTPNVTSAMTSTTGTKTAETRSARRCAAPLPACARSTRATMRASALSAPTAVARTVNTPFAFNVAPLTWLPVLFSAGTLSPVSIDSSTALAPSTTSPSTGIFSPGRTRTTSPTRTRSTGTRCSPPSEATRRACFAPSSRSALIAAPARRFARASK